MKKPHLFKMVLSAMLLAIAYLFPFATLQNQQLGQALCLLHLPVLLCGFICGWQWGLSVGFIAPVLRSLTLGMPPIFPNAVCMAFELAAYGAVSGIMQKLLPPKKPFIYCSLLVAMLAGRIVWGVSMLICMGINSNNFTISAFIAGAFTNAVPGIILQIALVPVLVMLLNRSKSLKPKE